MQPRAAFAGFVRSNGSESGVSDHRALCKGLFGHGGQEKSTAFGSLSPEGPWTELLRLATNYDRPGDHLDRRT